MASGGREPPESQGAHAPRSPRWQEVGSEFLRRVAIMPNGFPCPNPSCSHVFTATTIAGTGSLTCPRCGTVFQFRPGAQAPPRETAPAFDPYYQWLGIPQDKRPPTHYQLLGISPAEQDVLVIHQAAVQRMNHLNTLQTGLQAQECTRILGEVALARAVLLDPIKRQEYD